MNAGRLSFLLVAFVVLTLVSSKTTKAQGLTQWIDGTGNWFDASEWSAGVPDQDDIAEVVDGVVSFSSEPQANILRVGPSDSVNLMASVIGTADLVVGLGIDIGRTGGTGMNRVGTSSGKLVLTNSDMRVIGRPYRPPQFPAGTLSVGFATGTGTNNSFTGNGELQVTGGDISVPLSISVGRAGSTGTNVNQVATGVVNLIDGTITTEVLLVGNASGTGSGVSATAVGEMNVSSGSVILENTLLDSQSDETRLFVGTAGGTGVFDGNATGTLRVSTGDIVADIIVVGKTNPIAFASGSSEGSLYLTDGNLMMKQMELGVSMYNGGPADGLFQHFGGTTTGQSLIQGQSGQIVLGIGGPLPGQDYSQILVDNITLDGAFEARFVDNYLPQPGDVFDLAIANNISGIYDFHITGIDQADYPNMVVTRNSQLIRIAFVVPEPNTVTAMFLYLALATTVRKVI
jgi:hypothetical protein